MNSEARRILRESCDIWIPEPEPVALIKDAISKLDEAITASIEKGYGSNIIADMNHARRALEAIERDLS